jgi:uncharacterized protein YyaL (SSP411 family)
MEPDRKPNHLMSEKSPYLREHAHNPVDWFPWGDEAIGRAKAESKPILLSIGYSSCHWCHVMNHESFEDEATAAVINKDFVAIKVDREERPELDDLYMTAVQSMTGQGGWPLTVFLTPDLKPFFGGTYFPKQPTGGMPSFRQVLEYVTKAWKENRADVVEQAAQIMGALKDNYQRTSAGPVPASLLEAGYATLVSAFDPEQGGFGGAPKFPVPLTMAFLLRYYHRKGKELALRAVLKTLESIAAGGIRDHLGGGFHRYSTDRLWLVPHFEKMLYDNALLARVYLEAFQVTGSPSMLPPAREALEWMMTEMEDHEGGFYSAQDADSEGGEGAYYTWTPEEVASVLGGQDGETFCYIFGVAKRGNFDGPRSVLHLAHSLEEAALRFSVPQDELAKKAGAWRSELYQARLGRPRPATDRKILTSWNGLAISALALASRVLGDARYLEAADRCADFVQTWLTREGALLRRFVEGDAALPGTLEDYSFFTQALIDLFEASGDPRRLEGALALHSRTNELFLDKEDGAYYMTVEALPARIKVSYDGSTPSGNSVAVLNSIRLAELTGNQDLRAQATRTLEAFHENLEEQPSAHANLLIALDLTVNGLKEIVVSGTDERSVRDMVGEIDRHYVPEAVLVRTTPRSFEALGKLTPLVEGRGPREKTRVYICENYACRRPIEDPQDLKPALERRG